MKMFNSRKAQMSFGLTKMVQWAIIIIVVIVVIFMIIYFTPKLVDYIANIF